MGAIMNKFKAGPSEGVFDSSAVKDLFEAFEKADAHVNPSDSVDVIGRILLAGLSRKLAPAKHSRTFFGVPQWLRC